jgi:hypothetical protein
MALLRNTEQFVPNALMKVDACIGMGSMGWEAPEQNMQKTLTYAFGSA